MYRVSHSWSVLSATAAISLDISWARHCIWVTYGCIPMNFSKVCLCPFIFLASATSCGNYLTVQLCNNTEKCFLLFILNSLPDNFIVCVSSWVPMLQEIQQVFPVVHNKFCNCHISLSCSFQDEESIQFSLPAYGKHSLYLSTSLPFSSILTITIWWFW